MLAMMVVGNTACPAVGVVVVAVAAVTVAKNLYVLPDGPTARGAATSWRVYRS
jgi:hypothetical protein